MALVGRFFLLSLQKHKKLQLMIFRVEINSQTKAGRKVYELIESLWGKDGITYLDEDEYLSKEEEEELKEELIQIFDDINNESLSEDKRSKDNTKIQNSYKRAVKVAGK